MLLCRRSEEARVSIALGRRGQQCSLPWLLISTLRATSVNREEVVGAALSGFGERSTHRHQIRTLMAARPAAQQHQCSRSPLPAGRLSLVRFPCCPATTTLVTGRARTPLSISG